MLKMLQRVVVSLMEWKLQSAVSPSTIFRAAAALFEDACGSSYSLPVISSQTWQGEACHV